MKKYDVTIAGYFCIDLIPCFNRDISVSDTSNFFIPGKLIEIDGLSFLPGGVVANTGLALKKFNKKVFLNGLIGDDFIGKIALEWFGSYGLSEGFETTQVESTALSVVIAPPGIDRIFLESPGCNKVFNSASLNYKAISESRLFHFGYPPLLKQFYLNGGVRLVEMFTEVRRMGVITSLDFSLPDAEIESGKVDWPEIMKNVLPFTDIFVPSLEEALQIMLPSKYAEIQSACVNVDIIDHISIDLVRILGKHIIGSGVKILLLKMAHRGVYLLTGNVSSLNKSLDSTLSMSEWNYCELLCNAYHVDKSKFKDATGAGDTAVAAFITAILNGESPELSLKYAAIAGRDNLYCQNIYTELVDWQAMTEEIFSESNDIVHFKPLT
jgi:sugar/nucleoside kinase (ribokinase family)